MRNKIIYLIALCLLQTVWTAAQNIGINTTGVAPDSSAMLDIVSADKGLLIPRMDSTSRKNIVMPAEGLMVFDSTYNSFWYHNGLIWQPIEKGLDQQNLSLINDSLYLSNDLTPVDLSFFKQDLSFSNDTLRLSGNSSAIDLKPYMENLVITSRLKIYNSVAITSITMAMPMRGFISIALDKCR